MQRYIDTGTEVATNQIVASQFFDINYVYRGQLICEDWSTVGLERQDAVLTTVPKARAAWAENPKAMIIAAHSRGIVEIRKSDWGSL